MDLPEELRDLAPEKKPISTGFPLEAAIVEKLRVVIALLGEPKVCELCGVSKITLPRCVAALPVTAETHRRVTAAVERIGGVVVEGEVK